ncbi:MAG: phytoene desaturase family protein [Acidimicrobiia bacterium]
MADAVVVGAGPNGLSAAIRIAQAGRSVLVIEAAETIGGGTRTAELTLPGFSHDVCSAIHPMGVGSPFFRTLPLQSQGLEWIHPDLPLAHPLDDGRAATLARSVDETAEALGPDEEPYRKLFEPLVRNFRQLARGVLAPLVRVPRHPLMARMGLKGTQPAERLARRSFGTEEGRALFAGLGGHSIRPLGAILTAGPALFLGAAGHAYGWPMPRGGSQSIADALAGLLTELGGAIEMGREVKDFSELPPHEAVLFDTSPQTLERIAASQLPGRFRARLRRFRHGPGVFKVDYALDGPVPWTATECRRAGTVHVGGTLEEITAAEAQVGRGQHPERPFVLVAQPSLFDQTRAPEGKHVLWAYTHVPAGSTHDLTTAIESQIERFAPGFRDLVLARAKKNAAEFELYNANNVGGDISGGEMTLRQMLRRPKVFSPYTTPADGIYLCSASTPPGAGVHGMCGYWAAEAALKRELS